MDYLKGKTMYKRKYFNDRYRYDNDYRRRYYNNYWYPYSIYDSQLSNIYQSIYNSGYMSDVYQINNVNQIMDRRYPYWY